MNRLLLVCPIALIAAVILYAGAQSPPLRQGVSVHMATTENASPMPAADNQDAWIVAVTADGRLYFGVKAVTPDQLFEEMKATPRNRNAKLYVKADVRAPFGAVEKALNAGREVWFQEVVLLTQQPQSPGSATPVLPNGLDVAIDPAARAGGVATVVQLLKPEQPSLSVNNEEIPWPALESTLRRHFEKGDPKVVLVKADLRLPFGEVAKVIDVCRATGAQISLEAAGL